MILRLPRDTALVLVDFQEAIDHPKWGVRNNPGAEARAAELIALWRKVGAPVIHIRHDSAEPQSPYRPGQPGHVFKLIVAPISGERIVAKSTPSAFIGTSFEADLEAIGATTLVVCGVLTQNSVDTTVRQAGCLGFRVVVVEDATAASDVVDVRGRLWQADDVHALTLGTLAGEYAAIASSETVSVAFARWLR
jgi:nicotinamidase-related amidase